MVDGLVIALLIAFLVLLVVTSFAVLRISLRGSDTKAARNTVYLLKVDDKGKLSIKRYRGNVDLWHGWQE